MGEFIATDVFLFLIFIGCLVTGIIMIIKYYIDKKAKEKARLESRKGGDKKK